MVSVYEVWNVLYKNPDKNYTVSELAELFKPFFPLKNIQILKHEIHTNLRKLKMWGYVNKGLIKPNSNRVAWYITESGIKKVNKSGKGNVFNMPGAKLTREKRYRTNEICLY